MFIWMQKENSMYSTPAGWRTPTTKTDPVTRNCSATLSLVFPSLVVIMVIAKAMDKYQKNPLIQNMFAFMRPAVTGPIAAAGFSVLKIALFKEAASFFESFNWIAIALFAILLVCTQLKKLKKLHPIVFIAIGAVIGMLLKM